MGASQVQGHDNGSMVQDEPVCGVGVTGVVGPAMWAGRPGLMGVRDGRRLSTSCRVTVLGQGAGPALPVWEEGERG